MATTSTAYKLPTIGTLGHVYYKTETKTWCCQVHVPSNGSGKHDCLWELPLAEADYKKFYTASLDGKEQKVEVKARNGGLEYKLVD